MSLRCTSCPTVLADWGISTPVGCMDNFEALGRRAHFTRERIGELPVNLGPAINTTANEVAPNLSHDRTPALLLQQPARRRAELPERHLRVAAQPQTQ